jgi:hypothetical protein
LGDLSLTGSIPFLLHHQFQLSVIEVNSFFSFIVHSQVHDRIFKSRNSRSCPSSLESAVLWRQLFSPGLQMAGDFDDLFLLDYFMLGHGWGQNRRVTSPLGCGRWSCDDDGHLVVRSNFHSWNFISESELASTFSFPLIF